MRRSAVLAYALLAVTQSHGATAHITLSNGAISFVGEDGRRRELPVGYKCADLWVSPDESVFAFIAIEKALPPTAQEIEPFIEESSIYIARRSDQFRPVRLNIGSVQISGKSWKVVRQPSVSPDLKTVYFLVPYTMTAWKLLGASLAGNLRHTVGDAMTYCVVWGGKDSGDLLMMTRHDPTPTQPAPGVTYPCYLREISGRQSLIVDGVAQECWDFDAFSARWSREHGGVCRPTDGN
jgi:hypothetical protein